MPILTPAVLCRISIRALLAEGDAGMPSVAGSNIISIRALLAEGDSSGIAAHLRLLRISIRALLAEGDQ